VVEAAKELHDHGSGQTEFRCPLGERMPSDAARSAIEVAISKLATGHKIRSASSLERSMSSAVSTQDTLPPLRKASSPGEAPEKQMEGAVLMKMPPSEQQKMPASEQHKKGDLSPQRYPLICPTCGDCGKFCVECGQPNMKLSQRSAGGCQTCGAANFCVFCGAQTQRMRKTNMANQQHGSPEQVHQVCNSEQACVDQNLNSQMMLQGGACGAGQFMPMPGMPGMMMMPMQGMMPGMMPMQGYPVLQDSSSTAAQAPTSSPSSANESQACVGYAYGSQIPMGFLSVGYDVVC